MGGEFTTKLSMATQEEATRAFHFVAKTAYLITSSIRVDCIPYSLL